MNSVFNCPYCQKELAVTQVEITIPVQEPEPVPIPSGLPEVTGIYFPPKSDYAVRFFTVLNEIKGGNGTRENPLLWKAGERKALRFRMDANWIPQSVRSFTFTIRAHLQLTHPCTKVDGMAGTEFSFDQLDADFEISVDTMLRLAGVDYSDETKSNRTIYLNVSDNALDGGRCYFTSGKLFLREVIE